MCTNERIYRDKKTLNIPKGKIRNFKSKKDRQHNGKQRTKGQTTIGQHEHYKNGDNSGTLEGLSVPPPHMASDVLLSLQTLNKS